MHQKSDDLAREAVGCMRVFGRAFLHPGTSFGLADRSQAPITASLIAASRITLPDKVMARSITAQSLDGIHSAYAP